MKTTFMVFGLLWSGGAFASADGVCPATPAATAETAGAIVTAFQRMQDEVLKLQHERLVVQQGCLDAAPSPAQVAAIYLSEALFASFEERPAAAEDWLRAMMEADPGAQIPPEVAPEGTKLSLQLRSVRGSPAKPRQPALITSGYTLLLDGVPSALRPTDRPSLYVILDDHAKVWGSGVLAESEALPRPPPLNNLQDPWPRPLVIAEASTVALSAGLWIFALVERGKLNGALDEIEEGKAPMTAAELQALTGRTNGLGYAAQATTGLAVGLAAVGFAVRW